MIFDANDVNYLVNNLSSPQLVKEIRNNEIWTDYTETCELALAIQRTLAPKIIKSDGKIFESIESIKSRYDIVDYIGQYVKLKKSGANYSGVCPFHSEKKGSFYVYTKNQTWHCFGACSRGGDIITFVMLYENLDVKSAIQRLAK